MIITTAIDPRHLGMPSGVDAVATAALTGPAVEVTRGEVCPQTVTPQRDRVAAVAVFTLPGRHAWSPPS